MTPTRACLGLLIKGDAGHDKGNGGRKRLQEACAHQVAVEAVASSEKIVDGKGPVWRRSTLISLFLRVPYLVLIRTFLSYFALNNFLLY